MSSICGLAWDLPGLFLSSHGWIFRLTLSTPVNPGIGAWELNLIYHTYESVFFRHYLSATCLVSLKTSLFTEPIYYSYKIINILNKPQLNLVKMEIYNL